MEGDGRVIGPGLWPSICCCAVGSEGEAPGHAFISYVHEDVQAADQLHRLLEAAGIRVWRDTASLWPGQDWRHMIRRAITGDALVFIACFSSKSESRDKSYQNEELTLAVEQVRQRRPGDSWLIPVRFDDCEIPDWDIGGGRTLKSIQHVDLFGEISSEGAARLVASVLRILGAQSGSAVLSGTGPGSVASSSRSESRSAIELGASGRITPTDAGMASVSQDGEPDPLDGWLNDLEDLNRARDLIDESLRIEFQRRILERRFSGHAIDRAAQGDSQ